MRPARAFYGPHWAIRAYSGDDAIFFQSIKSGRASQDCLLASFANTSVRGVEAYTAVTSSALTVTWRENNKLQVETVDLKAIVKVTRPQVNQVLVDYSRASRDRRSEKKLLIEVTDEGSRMKESIEELISIIQL